jgi:hypothetical protein
MRAETLLVRSRGLPSAACVAWVAQGGPLSILNDCFIRRPKTQWIWAATMRKIAGESRRHSLRRLTHGNLAPAALNKIAKLAGDHQVSKSKYRAAAFPLAPVDPERHTRRQQTHRVGTLDNRVSERVAASFITGVWI